ncbi:MAG: nitrate/nitrite transporter NrtS [Colwellia sp.]|nr:nitrate/nitrite transporter NrtS [Colwellia sp.]
MLNWLAVAIERKILRRSLIIAAIVGTILTLINHGDIIISGNIQTTHLVKIVLTYFVPYAVSTYSSVQSKINP